MTEENKFQKRGLIIEDPQIFPHLTKRVLNLDDFIISQKEKNKLGEYGILLNQMRQNSIYKKLLLPPEIKDSQTITSYNPQEIREIRNKYLKKLVESNPFYFPRELSLEEYKKPVNSKEERISKLLKHLEEQAKKEKSYNDSRKNSSILILNSRKESMFLENKRKRTESVMEEIDDKKKKMEKSKSKMSKKKMERCRIMKRARGRGTMHTPMTRIAKITIIHMVKIMMKINFVVNINKYILNLI